MRIHILGFLLRLLLSDLRDAYFMIKYDKYDKNTIRNKILTIHSC